MRTRYLFLCTYQAPRKFPQQGFLEVRRDSLKVFSLPPRKTTGIEILSVIGLNLPLLLSLSPLSALIGQLPPSLRPIGLIAVPVYFLWVMKTIQWSVPIAFHYSRELSNVGTDVRPGEVRFGFLNHKLQVEVEGRQVVLVLTCRRRTLSNALRLADQQ